MDFVDCYCWPQNPVQKIIYYLIDFKSSTFLSFCTNNFIKTSRLKFLLVIPRQPRKFGTYFPGKSTESEISNNREALEILVWKRIFGYLESIFFNTIRKQHTALMKNPIALAENIRLPLFRRRNPARLKSYTSRLP